MDEKKIEAEELLLDLLANAPSSFAALYGFVVRSLGSRPSVKEMIDILTALETSGCVRVAQMTSDGSYRVPNLSDRAFAQRRYENWLQVPGADLSVDALSFDPVGIWFELLPKGLADWTRRVSTRGHGSPPWTLDFNASDDTVVVHAPDAHAAHDALTKWLMLNPDYEARKDGTTMKSVPSFALRNGTVISGGVQVRTQLFKKASR